MKEIKEILSDLKDLENPEYISKMQHFGIEPRNALGIKSAQLKPYAKTLGKNQELADNLWNEAIHEAKLLAILLMEPKKITEIKAEKWVKELYSWDVCDGLGMKIFPKTPFAIEKAKEWCRRKNEFEKRAGFATIVGITLDRKISDDIIEEFFKEIEEEAWDDRNFVKKAVNWSLRQIGKRNLELNQKAITVAERVLTQETKSSKWIAKDALRELKSHIIQERLKKKHKKRAD